MRRRLLDQLEQRVERVRAEHVDLVDDVDAPPQLGRCGERPHHEVARVLDQAVAGGIDLDDVHGAPLADRDAGRASVAGLAVGAALGAVDGLGQDAGHRGLAGPPRADEQVGVGDLVGRDRVAQGGDDRILPDQLREALRAPSPIDGGWLRGRGGGGGVDHGLLTVHRTAARSRSRDRRNGRAPGVDRPPPHTRPSSGSSQVAPWHPKAVAYRCFLPDLTGFTDPRCMGPDSQRRSMSWEAKAGRPRPGIQSRCSGLRVQGTASSPPSTAAAMVEGRC